MRRSRFRVRGSSALAAALSKAAEEAIGVAASAVAPEAGRIARLASRLAPRDTGALAASIRVLTREDRTRVAARVVVGGGLDRAYAGPVDLGREAGGARLPGSHFLERAFDREADRAGRAVAGAIGDAIDRIAGG